MNATPDFRGWRPADEGAGLRLGFYGAGAMAIQIAQAAEWGHEAIAAYDLRRPSPPLEAVFLDQVEDLLAAEPDVVVHSTPRDATCKASCLC